MENYTYDAEGNLTKTVDTNGFTGKTSTKYEYQYDAEGNLTFEYKRETGASSNPVSITYTYDALNRIATAHEQGVGVNKNRSYEYDTLGNLIRETHDGCDEYLYNGTQLDESKECGVIPGVIGTCRWEYTYDNRGNLISNDKYTRTTTGMDWQNVATYVYDETNHMVSGKNEQGEYSLYTYNGLGVRVGRELIMQDNTHGYTDFHSSTPSVDTGLTTPEVVKESYVVDYTTATRETLTMHEDGGFDYRWVYGLDKLSVKITSEGTNWWGQNVTTDILKDYAHQDRMGSTTNLTDQFGRVVGRADYDEWGEITHKEALSITSAYRRIYPQLSYTGHDWDDVLGMYYAKARFYDPAAKRFVAMDLVKGNVADPLSLVPYIYCLDNPTRYIDLDGRLAFAIVTGIVGGIVGGAIGAYKSYKQTGSVSLSATLKGAATGALVGAGAGALAGVVLGGSAAASTTAVVSGAGKVIASASTAVKAFVSGAGAKLAQSAQKIVSNAKTFINTTGPKIIQGAQNLYSKAVNTLNTWGNQISQGYQKLSAAIHDLPAKLNAGTIELSTKLMTRPGMVGVMSTNAISNPAAAVGLPLSGIKLWGDVKQTVQQIKNEEYKEAWQTVTHEVIPDAFSLFTCTWALTRSPNQSQKTVPDDDDPTSKGNSASLPDNRAPELTSQDNSSTISNVGNNTTTSSNSTPSNGFSNWLDKGKSETVVYVGTKDGEAVYTGITKQPLSARLYQHNYLGEKGFDALVPITEELTRNQARSIEQFYIAQPGTQNEMNIINSISPSFPYYSDAMKWADQYITDHNITIP